MQKAILKSSGQHVGVLAGMTKGNYVAVTIPVKSKRIRAAIQWVHKDNLRTV